MSKLMVLRRMQGEGVTVHGVRSTFRDLASEVANAPREGCRAESGQWPNDSQHFEQVIRGFFVAQEGVSAKLLFVNVKKIVPD